MIASTPAGALGAGRYSRSMVDSLDSQQPRGIRIVCTLGPKSADRDTLRGMVRAGMNVARLNFSHGTHDEHAARASMIREIARDEGRYVALLQDLQGPKVRIGTMTPGSVLERGSHFALLRGSGTGDRTCAFIDDVWFFDEVRVDDRLLLADGLIELRVLDTGAQGAQCEVIAGGPLSSGKGINVPRGLLQRPILDADDEADLAFGARIGVDYVGISFVRTADDVNTVRSALARLRHDASLVAKIETGPAIENLASILDATDAVMLARGDLALETPFERVPMLQKRILEASRRRGRPVITATQMLVSMVNEPHPTRAEVNDVANAVLDGTDAVMLSEETAVGFDPVHVVATMARIASYTESCRTSAVRGPEGLPEELHELAVVAAAAARIAREVNAAGLVAWSQGGLAARMLSRADSGLPIVAPTPSEETARRLALVRDVTPLIAQGGVVHPGRVLAALGPRAATASSLVLFGHALDASGARMAWTRVARIEEPSGWMRDPGSRAPGG